MQKYAQYRPCSIILHIILHIGAYICQKNMQMPFSICKIMQNNMQTLNPIWKILQGLYSAYFAYICTAQFADDTTIYNRQRRPWFCRRLRQESPLTLFAFQRESFRSAPLEQVEAVPVWRKLELHTRLEIVHGARRRWLIDTRFWKEKDMIMQNMQNMLNMQNMTWFQWSFVLLQHRNKSTLVLLHPSVGHCTDFKQ